ncbi:MAG TPA: glycosyltransferase [Methylophilaceae bacterium]
MTQLARTEYEQWLDRRVFQRTEREQFQARMASWQPTPRFHLVINAVGASETQIARSLDSLHAQFFPLYQITVISNTACPPGLSTRVPFFWQPCHSAWSEAVNALLTQDKQSHWAAVLPAGDTLEPHSLMLIAEAIHTHADWHLVYVDEDTLEQSGAVGNPLFKPDINLEMLLAYPYLGDALFFRTEIFNQLAGLRTLGSIERHDFALRLIAAKGEQSIGHLPYVLHHRDIARAGAVLQEVISNVPLALNDYFSQKNIAVNILPGLFAGSFRVDYKHSDEASVSILIAVEDQLAALQECLESLLNVSAYQNFEVILLAAASSSPEMLAYLNGIEALDSAQLRVVRSESKPSLGALHNELARHARGDFLLFLYHDSLVLSDSWLSELVKLCRRAEVAAVAPRRLLPDGTVRSSGVILGFGGIGDSAFAGLNLQHAGYMNRAHLTQQFSALTAGCLLVKAQAFHAANGFDESLLDDALCTIEMSARLHSSGAKLIWTPHVNIMTRNTASTWLSQHQAMPGNFVQQQEYAHQLLSASTADFTHDIAYNSNLSLRTAAFSLEHRPEFNWDVLSWHPLPRILSFNADVSGCGQYRILAPTRVMNGEAKAQVWSSTTYPNVMDLMTLEVDSMVFQRQISPQQAEMMVMLSKFGDKFIVYDLDDLLINLPRKNIHAAEIPNNIKSILRKGVGACDRFTVSTEFLKHAYRDLHDDIVVVPNCIEYDLWKDLQPKRGVSRRPRIGWVGGSSHIGDLELIEETVRELAEEVDWVFMGLCLKSMVPYVKEVHVGVPFTEYPAKMASLNLDLALAPLQMHPFNEGKSHLRLLEYGILGIPVICTDILPYQGDYPVTRVVNKTEEWVREIREHINAPEVMARRGDVLRQHILQHWLLHQRIDSWLTAWSRP